MLVLLKVIRDDHIRFKAFEHPRQLPQLLRMPLSPILDLIGCQSLLLECGLRNFHYFPFIHLSENTLLHMSEGKLFWFLMVVYL